MSIQAELLLASTGVLGLDPVTIEDAQAGDATTAEWPGRLQRWVRGKDHKPYKPPPKRNLETAAQNLARPLSAADIEIITAQLVGDSALKMEYLDALQSSRAYLTNAWPSNTRTTPAGIQFLPLSSGQSWFAAGVLAVVEDPWRLVEELEMLSLTQAQAAAFRACYPEMFAAAIETLQTAMSDATGTRPDWEPTPDRIDRMRTLAGLQKPLEAKPPSAPAPQTQPLNLEKQFKKAQTKSQRIEQV